MSSDLHVSRQYNSLADMCTRFQELSEFEALLPKEIRVGSEVQVSAVPSPADNAPVSFVRLLPRALRASSPTWTPQFVSKTARPVRACVSLLVSLDAAHSKQPDHSPVAAHTQPANPNDPQPRGPSNTGPACGAVR